MAQDLVWRIITYEEAQALLPAFENLMKRSLRGGSPGVRKSWAKNLTDIVAELRSVRGDIEYSLGGKQTYFTPKQAEIYDAALRELDE